MAGVIQETARDVQTTLTSLGAAFAGVAADRVGDWVIKTAGGGQPAGLGAVGLQFIGRAAVSSLMYSAAANIMPETAANVFFPILFFAANKKLMADAIGIAQIVIGSTEGFLPTHGSQFAPGPVISQGPGINARAAGIRTQHGAACCTGCAVGGACAKKRFY